MTSRLEPHTLFVLSKFGLVSKPTAPNGRQTHAQTHTDRQTAFDQFI